jgi:hypothetical protein
MSICTWPLSLSLPLMHVRMHTHTHTHTHKPKPTLSLSLWCDFKALVSFMKHGTHCNSLGKTLALKLIFLQINKVVGKEFQL